MYKQKLGKEIKNIFSENSFISRCSMAFRNYASILVFGQLSLQEEHQEINIEKFTLSRNGTCKLVISPHRGHGILYFIHAIFIDD